VRVSCFEVYNREGQQWDKSLADFLRMGRYNPTPGLMKKVFAERERIFKRYFKRFIFSGVEEFLSLMSDNGYKLALVTGTPKSQLMHILPPSIKKFYMYGYG